MTLPPSAWPEIDEDTLKTRSDMLRALQNEVKGCWMTGAYRKPLSSTTARGPAALERCEG